MAFLLLIMAAAAVTPPLPVGSKAAPGCTAEIVALRQEHAVIRRVIADIATGRGRKRKGMSAAGAGRALAGTAATLLLPFGIGALANAGTSAALKDSDKKPKRQVVEPDVPGLIARQQAIEDRLGELKAAGCG